MPRKYVRQTPYRRIKPHNKVTPLQVRLLQQLVREATPVSEIAEALSLSRMHVYRLIRRYCQIDGG